MNSLRFFFEGQRIADNHTQEELGVEEDVGSNGVEGALVLFIFFFSLNPFFVFKIILL